tara:strand:- start:7061 stop:9736 length:2676 start_codon:yes stop_codon:yes gene_type:complete
MPGVYVGETKALVFPMLCDGYLKQTYADYNLAASEVDTRGGPWGLESFTLEAIITPYDVNGYGSWTTSDRGNLNSVRTPPSLGDSTSNPETYQSYDYFTTNRLSHKMMIYYNAKFQLYLENQAASNYNRPAEYRLVAEFADGSANVTSDVLLTGTNRLNNYSDSTSYYTGSSSTLRQITTNAQNALPHNTLSIDSTSWGNQLDVLAATATGSVTISGTPQAYYPAQNATASITASNNNFSVDTLAVAGTGSIKFGANPDSTTSSDTNEYIQVVSEDGNTTTKWFAITGANNGTPLQSSGYPAGSRAYDRKGTAELTCAQFVAAVNLVNAGWGGTVTGGTDPTDTSVGAPAIVANFVADINNPTGGNLSKGSAMPSGITINQMANGVAASVVTHNYFTITTGGSAKKYHPYPSGHGNATGTAISRNDGNETISVFPFTKGNSLANTYVNLANAINHANGNTQITAAVGSGSPLPLNLTVDAAGTTGNSYNITATNMNHVTVNNFSGGEAANEPSTKAIQLVDSDGTTTKFLAAHATKSTNATGSTITFGNPSVTYVLYRLPSGGGSNRANFAAAVNSVSALDITASDDGSNQNKVNLTQGTSGAAGNTNITESLDVVTVENFTGGVTAATPDEYIQIISADGAVTVKFKASNLPSQSTGSTGSGYTYFQIGANTTQSASNLISAINASDLNSKLTASSPSNNNVVKIQIATAGNSQSTTDTYSNVTTDNVWDTDSNQKIITGLTTTNLGAGEEIYNSSNQLVGTVATRDSASQITLTANPAATVGSTLYASQPREALYLENIYKISCVVVGDGTIKLFINNQLVKEQKITFTPRFKFDTTDCFIGQNGTNKNTQFFGELYEMAMYTRLEPTLNYHTLNPGFSDIIFYYRWDE